MAYRVSARIGRSRQRSAKNRIQCARCGAHLGWVIAGPDGAAVDCEEPLDSYSLQYGMPGVLSYRLPHPEGLAPLCAAVPGYRFDAARDRYVPTARFKRLAREAGQTEVTEAYRRGLSVAGINKDLPGIQELYGEDAKAYAESWAKRLCGEERNIPIANIIDAFPAHFVCPVCPGETVNVVTLETLGEAE